LLGVQCSAAVDPASILDERPKPNARLFESCRVSKGSAPFTDGLAIQLLFASAAHDCRKRVGIHIDHQSGKLERSAHKPLGSSAPAVMPDKREHGSQISINSVSIASFVKLTPSSTYNGKPLPYRFLRLIFSFCTADRVGY
jgi:hypothetical protein